MQHVRKILQALKEADLQIKSEKNEFHVQNMQFLEFIITNEELKMNSKKIKAVIS